MVLSRSPNDQEPVRHAYYGSRRVNQQRQHNAVRISREAVEATESAALVEEPLVRLAKQVELVDQE
jgi:hypothetical protein